MVKISQFLLEEVFRIVATELNNMFNLIEATGDTKFDERKKAPPGLPTSNNSAFCLHGGYFRPEWAENTYSHQNSTAF